MDATDQELFAEQPVNSIRLRYGLNPYQESAALRSPSGDALPVEVLNGKPGYINLLDALTGWQIAIDSSSVMGVVSAASLKHTTPIGAGIAAAPLTAEERAVALLDEEASLSDVATAYVRARSADRISAYGDFVAVSDTVDVSLARILSMEVSDGIIAPGFDQAALEVLASKKQGQYLILQADPSYRPPSIESRTVFGLLLEQERNEWVPVVQPENDYGMEIALAQIVAKYAASNAITAAAPNAVIAVGAGQQSRIDAARIAAEKVRRWRLRRHPRLLDAVMPSGMKRYEWDNTLSRAVEQDSASSIRRDGHLVEKVPDLSDAERDTLLDSAPSHTLVAVSDGSIPFPDTVHELADAGIRVLMQPGGSIRDDVVEEAADQRNVELWKTGTRLFHH